MFGVCREEIVGFSVGFWVLFNKCLWICFFFVCGLIYLKWGIVFEVLGFRVYLIWEVYVCFFSLFVFIGLVEFFEVFIIDRDLGFSYYDKFFCYIFYGIVF